MSMITDITHYDGVLSPRSRASEPLKKIARFMGSSPPGEIIDSAIDC